MGRAAAGWKRLARRGLDGPRAFAFGLAEVATGTEAVPLTGATVAGWARPARWGLAVLLAFAVGLVAAASRAEGVALTGAAAARFEGVAALSVAGRRLCSAVLVAPDLAVTAAHCVAGRPAQELRLDFGAAGQARGVRALAWPEAHVPGRPAGTYEDLSSDLALLALEAPVTLAPLTVTPWPRPTGDFADIVGFERDGPEGPVLREGCMALLERAGVVVLDCAVVAGLSGAPVILQTRPEDLPVLVAIVSSQGEGRAYVVVLALQLAALKARLAGR
jgi:protease YdgD